MAMAGWWSVMPAFVNSVHREGSNLAMTSGRLAAETIIALRAEARPMNERNLLRYRLALNESFVIKDLKKYRHLPGVFHRNPQFLSTYPELLNQAAHSMLKVDGVDKKTKEREIRRNFKNKRSLFGLMGDAYKMWRAFE
jgi:electron transfer flavoprotein-quinone oxidoreductase